METETLKLIYNSFDRGEAVKPVVPFRIQKNSICSEPLSSPLPRDIPENTGVSSRLISDFINDILKIDEINMHGLMIIKDGKVIAETHRLGYSPDEWHSTYSLCKSVTGLAIGLLSDEGKINLDAPIRAFFKERKRSLTRLRRPEITVRHLLTMTSGTDFTEYNVPICTDYVGGYLDASEKFDAGEKFHYNSLNSYMLAAIVESITKQNVTEYLRPRLFEPLGITEYYWETCDQGIEKGGWGMYLKLEDMAKLGLLVLNFGKYGEKQLISEAYIREMTTSHAFPTDTYGKFNYGYHLWTAKDQDTFLFNGLFGQNVTGIRKDNMVIASIAGSSDAFQEGPYFDILDRYFFHPTVDYSNSDPKADSKLLKTSIRHFERALSPIFEKRNRLLTAYLRFRRYCSGKTYRIDSEEPALGLLPKITHMVQNNYPSGMESLGFTLSKTTLLVHFRESGRDVSVPFGLLSPIRSIIDFQGEPYIISSAVRISLDENCCPTLKMKIDFVETVSSRIITVHFTDDKIRVNMTESPGPVQIEQAAGKLADALRETRFVGSIATKLDIEDYLLYRIRSAILPEFTATAVKQEQNVSEEKTT